MYAIFIREYLSYIRLILVDQARFGPFKNSFLPKIYGSVVRIRFLKAPPTSNLCNIRSYTHLCIIIITIEVSSIQNIPTRVAIFVHNNNEKFCNLKIKSSSEFCHSIFFIFFNKININANIENMTQTKQTRLKEKL